MLLWDLCHQYTLSHSAAPRHGERDPYTPLWAGFSSPQAVLGPVTVVILDTCHVAPRALQGFRQTRSDWEEGGHRLGLCINQKDQPGTPVMPDSCISMTSHPSKACLPGGKPFLPQSRQKASDSKPPFLLNFPAIMCDNASGCHQQQCIR